MSVKLSEDLARDGFRAFIGGHIHIFSIFKTNYFFRAEPEYINMHSQ